MKSSIVQAMKSFPEIKTQYMADVEYGVPTANAKCKNFGICRIVPKSFNSTVGCCNGAKSVAIVTVFSLDKVVLDFLKETINEEVYQKYFSKGKFLVQKDYHFDTFSDEKSLFVIRKGEYKIYETSTLVKVVFS